MKWPWKRERLRKVSISIKRGYLALLLAQAAVIGVCSFAAVRIFYHNYTALLYDQASTLLDLYVINCENKLSVMEKWSFNILSHQTMQAEMESVDTGVAGGYDAYVAKKNVERLLTGFLFSMDNAESVRFISNDGSQMIGSYNFHDDYFPAAEIERLRMLSGPRKGGTVWTCAPDGDRLYLLRTIREVHSNKFRDLGVLVIACPVSKIFLSEFPGSYSYQPVIVVSDGESNIYSSAGKSWKADAQPRRDASGADFVQLGQERYYYAAKVSPHTGWTYTCYIPDKEVLRNVNLLNLRIMAALIAVLAASLFLTLRFSLSITSRIERLSGEMDAVRAGKYRFQHRESGELCTVNEVEALSSNFYYMAGEIDHLVNDVFRKQLMIKDMQYKILQGQINPHFFYNTLETINSLAKSRGQQEISLVVRSLSRMLRASLCGQDMHSLRSEMELLESYIAIQKIRFEERLLFTMELQEGLDDVPIPKLTLQPLVENSISYGLERFSRPCRIHVKAQQRDGDVVIAVSDNGPGMEQEFVARIFSGEITPKGTGLGIKNIHERVRLAFGEAYGVRFESRPGKGTTACVRIPFDADGKEE